MSVKHLRKCSAFLNIRKINIKTTVRFYLTPVRLRSKTQVTADAGEDVEKEKHSCTAGGIASWCKHSGNQSGRSSENWA